MEDRDFTTRLGAQLLHRLAVMALLSAVSLGGTSGVSGADKQAPVASIRPDDLVEFVAQPKEVQHLIRLALDLTTRNLGYRYGSGSPANHGMDCSGTICYTLASAGLPGVPRSSHSQYQWLIDRQAFHAVKDAKSLTDAQFDNLKPGDLLFWEGTYDTGKRNPPISHVMLYLGTLKKDGKPVAFGASNGRSFRGQKIYGVSVFDFQLPRPGSSARFVGFGTPPLEVKAQARSGN